MYRFIVGVFSFILTTQAFSFPCYITLIKASCWKNYDVTVQIEDVMIEKPITSMLIPSGAFWTRYEFACKEKQTIELTATFSPAIWEKDEGKQYKGKRFWSYPETIGPTDTAWNMTICYPNDFAELPTPAEAADGCVCDKQAIPAIEKR